MFRPLAAIVSLLIVIGGPTMAWSQSADTDSIPSSATLSVLLRPGQLLNQPGMELVPREIISAWGQQELGFDPMKITRLLVLVESPETMERPPAFAVVLEFDSPQTLSEKITGQLEEEQWQGRPVYRSGPNAPVFYLPNEQTILIGMESFIRQMQTASGANGQLKSMMEAAGSDAEVQIYFVMDPVRELILQNLPPAAQVPPPFVEFLELPNLVEHVAIEMGFAQDSFAQLKIGATDAAAAARIDEMLRQALATGQQLVLSQLLQQMQNESPAMQQAVAQYANRVGTYLQTQLRPRIEGKDLVFRGEGDSQLMALGSAGVLTGLLLPAVQQVREAARRVDSMNNLRQIALACHNYEAVYNRFPTNIASGDGKPLLSWRVALLPYMEETALYEQFHLDEPWDSEHNLGLLDQMPPIYQNANAPLVNRTVYQGFRGPGTIFQGEPVRFREITDGTSNTILCVESDVDAAVEWTRPADLPFDPDQPVRGVGNLRPAGFNAALADGSVRLISRSIDPETLRHLIQMNDGNRVRLEDE